MTATTPGGPAAAAGLRTGDVITALDGQQAGDTEQLDVLSVTRSPGDRVRVSYRRDGSSAETTVTLGTAPAGTQ